MKKYYVLWETDGDKMAMRTVHTTWDQVAPISRTGVRGFKEHADARISAKSLAPTTPAVDEEDYMDKLVESFN